MGCWMNADSASLRLDRLFIHCPGPQTTLDKLGSIAVATLPPAPEESNLEIPLSLARGRCIKKKKSLHLIIIEKFSFV